MLPVSDITVGLRYLADSTFAVEEDDIGPMGQSAEPSTRVSCAAGSPEAGGALAWLRRAIDAVRRHPNATVAVLAGVAFVVGAVLALRAGSTFDYADERSYVQLARNINDGLGFTLNGTRPTAYRPPAWPAVIAVVDLVGGGVTVTRLVNVAFFASTVVVLYALVRRVAGTDAGLLAAGLLAVYPLSLYTAATLYPQTFATLLVLLGLLATVIADRAVAPRSCVGWAAAAGVCFGVLGLTAPAYLVIAVVAVAWALWRRFSLRRVAMIAAPIMCVLLVPLAAWGFRNSAQLGTAVPFGTNGGLNLLLGNNPNATPTTGVDADISDYLKVARQRGLDEVESDRYFRDQATEWIKSNPGSATLLYFGKLANFFNYRSNIVTQEQSQSKDLLGAFTFYPLLALFLVRLAVYRKVPLRLGEVLLVASFFSYAVIAAVFFTRIRFRVPVEPMMIAVVACGAVGWWRSRPDGLPGRPLTKERRAELGHR